MKLIIYIILVIVSFWELQSQWIQNLGMPASYRNETYLDIQFLESNPNYGWACGFKGITLRTTDAGKTWLVAHLPFDLQLESIHFVNQKVGYTSGALNSGTNMGMILKSIDGGATWKNVTPDMTKFNTPDKFIEIWGNYFIDENTGWVIGGGCGTVQRFFKTTNGGTTWDMLEFNEPSTKLADVIVYPNGRGYAVSSGWVWLTTNAGLDWEPMARTGASSGAFNNDWQEELAIFNQSFILPYSEGCSGSTDNKYGGVRISTDGGKNWKQHPTNEPMYGSFMVDDVRAWGVGFNRTAVYTENAGATWRNYQCGVPNGINFDDIWVVNDTTIWIAGDGIWQFKPVNRLKPQIAVNDTVIVCDGENVELSTTEKYLNYRWSTGESTPSIKVSKPGKYFVTVYNDYICDSATTKAVQVKTFNTQEVNLTSSNSGLPCKGDTVRLSIKEVIKEVKWNNGETTTTIEVTESGTYQAEIIDTNGCVIIKEITVNFDPNPKPQITKIAKKTLCVGDTVALIASNGYSQYFWHKNLEINHFSTNQAITLSESGSYFLKTVTSNGCVNYSDTIYVDIKLDSNQIQFVFVNNDSVFVIDSTNYPSLNCRDLEIKNISWKPAQIDNPYFLKNLAFSAPATQFPIVINPNETRTIKVCFSPRKIGEDRDTVLIADNCDDHLIPILSWGVLVFSSGNTKCDVDISVVPKGISNSLMISNPYPNPTSEKVEISYILEAEKATNSDFSAELFDIYGNKVADSKKNIENSNNSSNYYKEEGTINFEISNLTSGIYLVNVNSNGFSKILKVIKN